LESLQYGKVCGLLEDTIAVANWKTRYETALAYIIPRLPDGWELKTSGIYSWETSPVFISHTKQGTLMLNIKEQCLTCYFSKTDIGRNSMAYVDFRGRVEQGKDFDSSSNGADVVARLVIEAPQTWADYSGSTKWVDKEGNLNYRYPMPSLGEYTPLPRKIDRTLWGLPMEPVEPSYLPKWSWAWDKYRAATKKYRAAYFQYRQGIKVVLLLPLPPLSNKQSLAVIA
jgi:hypothetical protein